MRCAGLVAHINERWEHEEDAVGHERCVHTDDTRPEPRAIRMRVRGSSNEVGSGGFALPASTPEAARHTDHGLSIGPIGTSPSERDGCGPVLVKRVIRAGKAFVSAPRTFALELTRASTRLRCR